MNAYRSFAITVTGINHKKDGKECQDASVHETIPDMSVGVVADGLSDGNCFRSATGARIAADCAVRGLRECVEYINGQEKGKEKYSQEQAEKCLKESLIRDGIIRLWHKLVADDFTGSPFTEEELKGVDKEYRDKYSKSQSLHHAYATTLIAAAVTDGFWFGIHIGDGRLTALYPDGTYDQPVPWDERCFMNRTTSISDGDAAKRARFYFSFHVTKPLPVAVFLCSDGIDDNYPVYENEKHLFSFYRTIALTFAEDGFESTCAQLESLASQFATECKGDDTSIAGFIDMEALKQAVPIWQKQLTEEESIQ